jgi:hypothetical protein
MKTTLSDVRAKSFQEVERLGFGRNDSLPLLDCNGIVRSLDEILDRLLTMQCVAAVAYGFGRKPALMWMKKHLPTSSLTPDEQAFIESGKGSKRDFTFQIEGIWALFWCCEFASEMSFEKNCPDDFADQLPDITANESPVDFRSRARLRESQEIIQMADLAYCMHWALVDCAINSRTTGKIPEYVVRERRHALEWLLNPSAWQEISLDT